MRALILFGHGSPDPLWRQPMEAVAARIAALDATVAVRCAFLEVETPSLLQAADELAAAGARDVSVLPMFLGNGRHARDDLPRLIAQVRSAHPELRVALQRSIGEDERVVDLVARIALGSTKA